MVPAFVVTVLLAGCAGIIPPFAGTPTPSQTAANPSPPAPSPISPEQMITAPVPSLCEHPAGILIDGALDGAGDNDGGAWISRYPDPVWRSLSFHSWQGADAEQYAALVMDCNQGGVGWPPHVVFYTSGPTVVGEIDVSDVVGDGRQGVEALAPLPNGVRLTLSNTYQDGDGGCCGTLGVVADFFWDGFRPRGEVVERIDEKATAQAAFVAALTGDRTAIRRLFTADGRQEALKFHDHVYLPDPEAWSEEFSCRAAGEDLLFDGPDRAYDRVCYFGAKDAYLVAFVAMRLVDFGQWKAAGVQFTTTD